MTQQGFAPQAAEGSSMQDAERQRQQGQPGACGSEK
jgi:hypothetical protein